MIFIPMTTTWGVCTPTVFRYLPATYVDAFFADGSLRLSSFELFKQHEDEQRLDKKEGEVALGVDTQHPKPRLLFSRGHYGLNAFVLAATMRYDRVLMDAFRCDSYIRINDTTEFAMRVSRHVPGLTAGFEGPCLYQDKKLIVRSIDHLDIDQFVDPTDSSKINRERLERFTQNEMRQYPLFLKDKSYSHQVEYRLLWMTAARVTGFLDIKVPEAIPFCSRPKALTE